MNTAKLSQTLLSTPLVLLLGGAGIAVAQEKQLPDAAALLDAADAKVASDEARKGLTSLRVVGEMVPKGFPMEGAVEERFLGSDRAWVQIAFKGMTPSSMGHNQTYCWTTDPAMGVMTLGWNEAGGTRRMMAAQRLAKWREVWSSAKTVGSEKLEKVDCWKIQLTAVEGTKEHLLLGKESGLMHALDLALPDFTKGTIAMRFMYEDWKEVGGVLYPHKRRQVVGTYDIQTNITKVELGAKLSEKDLAPSERIVRHWHEKGSKRHAASDPGVCKIETLPEGYALTVRLTVEESQVAQTLAVILPEVMGYLGEKGVTPAGPPFTRIHGRSENKVDLEGGIPVREKIEGKDRVKSAILPAGPAAVTWHHGSYHELPKSYAVLEKWIGEEKLRSRAPMWEIYWTDPGLETDPKKWRTQLIWPVHPKR